jgi:hypothetical protein
VSDDEPDIDLETAGVAEPQEAMGNSLLTSEALVRGYLDRIERYDRRGPPSTPYASWPRRRRAGEGQ